MLGNGSMYYVVRTKKLFELAKRLFYGTKRCVRTNLYEYKEAISKINNSNFW